VGEAGGGAPPPLRLGASPGGPHQDSLCPLRRGARAAREERDDLQEQLHGERVQLVQERDDLQEQLQKVLEREATAAQLERADVRQEAKAVERELAAEEWSTVALELTNMAKAAMKLIEEQRAALGERAAAVVKGEANLDIH
jgi:hypothetical protein